MTGCLSPGARPAMRAPPPRITNLALLAALLVAFASGVGTVAAGTPSGRWVAVAHGIVGVAVVLLVPWESMIVRRGLRPPRAPPPPWAPPARAPPAGGGPAGGARRGRLPSHYCGGPRRRAAGGEPP